MSEFDIVQLACHLIYPIVAFLPPLPITPSFSIFTIILIIH